MPLSGEAEVTRLSSSERVVTATRFLCFTGAIAARSVAAMLKRLLPISALALLAIAVPAQAAKPVIKYSGKTKEGYKISFGVDKKNWVTGLSTRLQTSCVSAQGGNPLTLPSSWEPPYNFKLGRHAEVTVKEPYPTTTYKIT